MKLSKNLSDYSSVERWEDEGDVYFEIHHEAYAESIVLDYVEAKRLVKFLTKTLYVYWAAVAQEVLLSMWKGNDDDKR
jgi:hypothetical protein